jgi:hypothetical protein
MAGQFKENGGRTAFVQAKQDNFEVVLEIWKCVKGIKTVKAWICNETSNTINNCMRSLQIWGRWYSAWCAQAKIWVALHSNKSRLFCYGVGTALYDHHKSPQNFVHLRQGSAIPYRPKWGVYIPRLLLHAISEVNPDRRVQFCEWFQNNIHEGAEFMSKIFWSDERTLKLNDTGNRRKCVYGSPEKLNIHVDEAVNLPGLTVWCRRSYRGSILKEQLLVLCTWTCFWHPSAL